MQTLLNEYITIVLSFARLISGRIRQHAQLLKISAILANGQRKVNICLLSSIINGFLGR